MSRQTVHVGDVVEVVILDHMQGSDVLKPVHVYGRVHSVTPDTLVVDSWALPEGEDREQSKHDITQFALIRKAVTSVTVLKKGK